METYLGELTALSAALSFSLASTFFTLAGRKFGASVSMALSLLISLVFLLPLHQITQGEVFPFGVSEQRALVLCASSLAGYVLSALLLLRSFQAIGPRLTMLITATSPTYAAFMAWLFLGQGLPTHATLGIALVLGGVVTVVSGDARHAVPRAGMDYRRGVLTALGAALTQGASFALMSEGVAGGFPAMSASLIRTVFGLAALLILIALRGKLRENLRLIVAQPRALLLIMLASLSGPVIGATLVLLSLQYTSVGISSTLTGTTPILLIPIGYVVFGDRITARAVAGTFVAISGVALLFM